MSNKFTLIWDIPSWGQFVQHCAESGSLCCPHRSDQILRSPVFEIRHVPFSCMLVPNYVHLTQCRCERQTDGTYQSSIPATLRTAFFLGLNDPTSFPDDIEIKIGYTVSILYYGGPIGCVDGSLTQDYTDLGYSNLDGILKYRDRWGEPKLLMNKKSLCLSIDVTVLSSNLVDVDY